MNLVFLLGNTKCTRPTSFDISSQSTKWRERL